MSKYHVSDDEVDSMDMKEKGMQKKLIFVAAAVAVVAVVSVLLILALGKKEETYRSIKIIELGGSVTIEREGVGVLTASSNMNLISGDAVKTEPDAYAVLQLDADKYVMLAESGSMTVVAEGDETNSRTSIRLDAGSVLNEIQNPLSSGSSYDIVTPNATMSVRGTVFEVRRNEDDADGNIEVLVYDGKVAVGMGKQEPFLCEAGEYVQFTAEEDPQFIIEKTEITEENLNPQFMERLEQINSQSRELDLGEAQLASAQTQGDMPQSSQAPAVSEPSPTPSQTAEPKQTEAPKPETTPAATAKPVSTPKPQADGAASVAPKATPTAPPTASPSADAGNQDDGDEEEDDRDNGADNSEDIQLPGGNTGNEGNTGNSGNSGNTGNEGNTGNSGNSGNTGNEGNTGNTGNEGNTGNSGNTGNEGNTGNSGNSGNTGNEGNTGNSGNSGNTGNEGNTGNGGNSGNTGNEGNTGNTGNEGNTGNSGNSGNTGNEGNTGNSGNSGNTGNEGNTGNSGNTGNEGDSGNTGNNPEDQPGDTGNSQSFWQKYTFTWSEYKQAISDGAAAGTECKVYYYLPYVVTAENENGTSYSTLVNNLPACTVTQATVGNMLPEPARPAGPEGTSLTFVDWCLEDGTIWFFDDYEVQADMCLYPLWKDENGKRYFTVIGRSENPGTCYCNVVEAETILKEPALSGGNDPAFLGWKRIIDGSEWHMGNDAVYGTVSLKAFWDNGAGN